MSDIQSNEVANPAAPLPRFTVTQYRPDGGFNAAGVAMLISALVLIGAVLGFAAHLVSQFFYLIILFPCLIGAGLGIVGRKMVVSGRVRNPIIGGVAGFLGGVLAMTMMHYFDYEQFKSKMAELKPETIEMVEVLSKVPPERRRSLLDADITAEKMDSINKLVEVGSIHSFAGFMNFEAKEGVTIGSTHAIGNKDRGMNLGYYGSYIYWLVEILIVAGITFAMVKSAAAEPFCVKCSDWKKPSVLGFFAAQDLAPVSAAIQSGDLSKIVAQVPTEVVTPLKLSAAVCPHCSTAGDVDLKLEYVTADNKGNPQFKTIAHSRYPGQARDAVAALFIPKPVAMPEPVLPESTSNGSTPLA